MPAPVRADATEGTGSARPVSALLGAGHDMTAAATRVERASERLRLRLGLRDPPLKLSNGKLTASNISGIIPLAPGVEIDVAPKFLGTAYAGWREDFFAVAAITGQGGLLAERVSARYGSAPDLASLLGGAFAALFRERQRRPLRQYRQERWRDWTVGGELLPEENLLLDPDGLAQTANRRDQRNPHNAVVAAAAELLIAEVGDPQVRSDLRHVRAALGPQGRASGRTPPLPGRHRHWEPLIELSRSLLGGTGLSLSAGHLEIPGFVVKSWQAWETLTERGLRYHHGGRYRVHVAHQLGMRGSKPLNVDPDGQVLTPAGDVDYLVDAKYRASAAKGRTTIASEDVYESLAFALAAKADVVVLAYPKAVRDDRTPADCGHVEKFERITAMGVTIVGVEVEVRGIGRPRAFPAFARRLASEIEGFVAEARGATSVQAA